MSEEAKTEAVTEEKPEATVEQKTEAAAETKTEAAKAETIAGGKVEEKTEETEKPYWPDDWRDKMADYLAAGDDKAKAKRLKQLERYVDPTALSAKAFELEAKLGAGGLTKIPGEDATDEERAAYHKAIGVPEDPKEYVDNLSLPEGMTLGEQDKALAGDFAQALHGAGAPQNVMDAAYNWYLRNEEARAAEVDRQDDENRTEAMNALKEEYGPALERNTNAISSLFAYAPGGSDMENDASLFNRLLTGRMADGTIIGDDPDMVKFMVSVAKEINPVATVVDDAGGTGKGLDEEIKEIENTMRTDRRSYDKDEKMQARYRELLEAREKQRSRAA
jgi:hypothetical protein